nr:MAG TPA_asm: hypothetical protein [Caudoviricetes sp.]
MIEGGFLTLFLTLFWFDYIRKLLILKSNHFIKFA